MVRDREVPRTGLATRRSGAGPLADPAHLLLQRLVCFLASALDVRFAFVTGFVSPRAGETTESVAVWLATDYGLRFEFGQTPAPESLRAETRPYEDVLRRLWPAETDLVGLLAVCGPPLPLMDAGGKLLGHLAALNAGPARRVSQEERLKSLVRVAGRELERWAARA